MFTFSKPQFAYYSINIDQEFYATSEYMNEWMNDVFINVW